MRTPSPFWLLYCVAAYVSFQLAFNKHRLQLDAWNTTNLSGMHSRKTVDFG
jgi:hypothetical protein